MKLSIFRAAVLASVAAGSLTAYSAAPATTPRHPQSPMPVCRQCVPTPVGSN